MVVFVRLLGGALAAATLSVTGAAAWLWWRLGQPVWLDEIGGAFEPAVMRAPARAPLFVPLAQVSTRELCRLWRDVSIPAPDSVSVQLRRSLLDELERRDPTGFQWWLLTGAPTGGDPWRHFGGPHDPSSRPTR